MKRSKIGFTLIELLVVITIIGILMGLAISQLGGVLGDSEKKKMNSIMNTWIIKLNQYKSHYGYYPPFLYEEDEGSPVNLKEFQDEFIFSLKGMLKTDNGWSKDVDEKLLDQNRKSVQFHHFTESEFILNDDKEELIGLSGLSILVDQNNDGVIELDDSFLDDIISNLKLDYTSSEVDKVKDNKEQVKNLNESIAIMLLNDDVSELSNIYTWNIEKYLEAE
jgi:prepilin-type N-terminal cleavage/methylation domain-containing protein